MESPATRRMRLSASRSSLAAGRKSLSAGAAGPGSGASALPRPSGTSSLSSSVMQNSNRLTSQPTYDFISGEQTSNENDAPAQPSNRPASRPPSRQGSQPPPLKRTQLRQSQSQSQLQSLIPQPQAHSQATAEKHAEEVLALRSKVKSLDYELTSLRSERSLLTLQHEKELREAQSRADAEFAKFQAADVERVRAVRASEAAQTELREARDGSINDKAALERKLRDANTKAQVLEEEKEDAEGRVEEIEREFERFRVEEVEGKRSKLERSLEEMKRELETSHNRFESTRRRLDEREADVERLEKLNMELSSSAGGGEERDVLKREITEQVTYVRKLEGQIRDQNTELRRLRDERRGVQIVEEEKRALEVQMNVLREVEKRAGELEIQKEILEDEKRMWTSLLEREGGEQDEKFESPEAVVKALVNERIEHALAVDRLGTVESELAGKDETFRDLERELNALKERTAAAKESKPVTEATDAAASDGKAFKRLERQRQLAVKEVEYLRAQLKSLESEETMLVEEGGNQVDQQRSKQLRELEVLVDQYRSETQTLHASLSKLEAQPAVPLEPRGTKRAAVSEPEEDKSQLGPLLRKNKNLQTALQKVTSQSQLLATELQAAKSQLKALRNSSKTRVLELRDNPTAQHEAVKRATLTTLKQENADLMAQLRGKKNPKQIPVSALDALNMELKESEQTVAEKEKRMRRQREIWTDKAAEFRDVISSVLGYRVNFMPNGKVKVSSLYYQSLVDGDDNEDEGNNGDRGKQRRREADLEDPQNYILFDGEKGTMKISGGAQGDFGRDVNDLVEFWVKDRKEIPCFLAAMTLEFYEKYGGMALTS